MGALSHQVLPQSPLKATRPIIPGIDGFVNYLHSRVVREIGGQMASEFLCRLPVTQPSENGIHKLAVVHSIRLTGKHSPFRRMVLVARPLFNIPVSARIVIGV